MTNKTAALAEEVYRFIARNPGAYYSEITRAFGITRSVLDGALTATETMGLLLTERKNPNARHSRDEWQLFVFDQENNPYL